MNEQGGAGSPGAAGTELHQPHQLDFYCGCGARLQAPAGTPSVACPHCRSTVAVPPPPTTIATPVQPPLPPRRRSNKARRHIVSGVIGIGLGLGAFVVRELIKDGIRQNPDAMLEVALNPRAGQTVYELLQWGTYIGVGLILIGAVYLVVGLAGAQQ